METKKNIARILLVIGVAFCLVFAGFALNFFPANIAFGTVALAAFFLLTLYDVRYALFILIILMIFSPEVLMTHGAVGGRDITFRFDDLVILTISLAWLARMAFIAEKGTWRRSPLNFLLILYIFLNIFCSINGIANGTVSIRTTVLFTMKKIEYIVIFFLVLNSIDKISEVKFFFVMSLLICGALCAWGYYMILSGKMPGRFYGPFDTGEANTIAAYFVMNMSLAVALIFYYKDQVFKSALLYSLILLILIPFLLTLGRGGYVSMVASICFIGLFKGRRIVLIPVVLALLTMKYILPEEIFDRILSIGAVLPSSDIRAQSWDDRLGMWTRGISKWQRHPFLGNGPGSFDLGGVDNQYVMELATMGLIGLAVFLLIIGICVYIMIKVIRGTDDLFIRNITIGLLAGTVGYIVNGLSMSVFIIIRTMEPFWFHMGLICFVYRQMIMDKAAKEPQENQQLQYE